MPGDLEVTLLTLQPPTDGWRRLLVPMPSGSEQRCRCPAAPPPTPVDRGVTGVASNAGDFSASGGAPPMLVASSD
jgi:hypothetical protein